MAKDGGGIGSAAERRRGGIFPMPLGLILRCTGVESVGLRGLEGDVVQSDGNTGGFSASWIGSMGCMTGRWRGSGWPELGQGRIFVESRTSQNLSTVEESLGDGVWTHLKGGHS